MAEKVTVRFLKDNYSKREVMVPMRDGVRLYTAVYEPVDGADPGTGEAGVHPVIMIRTPFPLNPYGKTFTKDLRTYMNLFAAARYIIVFQNVRGQFMSEGEFENVRPFVSGKTPGQISGSEPGPVDEATDTYDTIEWLLANCRTNGKVGVKGMSYPGFYATMASLSGHPALKAVSPQAPVTDWFMGDDAHISGITQLPLYPFGASFFKTRKGPGGRWPKPVADLPEGDLYDAFMNASRRPMASLKDKLPFVDEMLSHPDYDDFWQQRNAASALKPQNLPGGKFPAFLIVAGFYDAEDCYGPFEVYGKLRAQAPDTEVFLCAGPWYHGAWKKSWYRNIGDVWFTPWSAEYFREQVEFPFFEHYLNGKPSLPAKVNILPSGETMPDADAAGSRARGKSSIINARPDWMRMEQWPPVGRGVEITLPSGSIISNPLRAVPYTDGILEYFSREAFVADQRFASRRPDVYVYSTDKLKEPLKVYGKVTVNLSMTVDQPDADIIVKLIDVRPDGYQLPVRIGAKPLRYRNSFSAPEPAEPGKEYQLTVELTDIAHHFMPGHRLMLQIQGTMFPLLELPAIKAPVEISINEGIIRMTAV
ncbi:MAG: CocE/NonD family hydrolase [Bacteroidales bacterium]|nr:CocE/NonD family hydrolase [Bacteroidales bacterium]